MDENTNTTLESLLQHQNEILQKLEESSDRKKDRLRPTSHSNPNVTKKYSLQGICLELSLL